MTQELVQAPAQNSEVTTLVQMAIEQKVPVEMLERLVALKERVDARDARASYFAALAKFQQLCGNIPKRKKARITTRGGGSFEYSYAPLDHIIEHTRPHETDCGFSHTWDVDLHPTGGALVIGCTLRHVDGHSERSTFPVPIDKSNPATSDAQKNGSAMTYGKRQSYLAVTGLTSADEDLDGAKTEGANAEPITAEQVANLSDLIDAVGANRKKFLGFMKVETLSEIPAGEYKRAVDALEERRGK
jgi:hypothetical protein